MSGPFLSEMWYRVAELRPQLHPHVRIHRQRFRGQAWYVLHDRGTGRVHRFTPATYALIDGMDGRRTLDALWSELAESLGDDAPSQDDVIRLMHQLHAADVLQSGEPPDIEELDTRRRKQARSLWLRNLMNPVAFRIPLWDPEQFLLRTWPLLRRLAGPFGMLVWLLVVGWAGVLMVRHWPELTQNLTDRVLGMENLLLLWLTYPVIKFCHEMGHAYAVKAGGGEVHEMGVMFLVFTPVPYVDATASAAFRSKWRRVLVGSAGMLVELFLASLALFVWLAVEPGMLRSLLFNVMLIGGVSTLIFNGNPLLRFDGYYILADLIEIPNLAQRGNRYLGYLAKHYAFGKEHIESPAHSRGERGWFLFYAPVSWVYRLFVMIGIALFIASKYFFVGVILALWSVVTMLLVPIFKALNVVLTHVELDRHRKRAVGVTFSSVAVLALVAGYLPLPAWTNAEGVVWVPENAEVRAGTGGFVDRLLVPPGKQVSEHEPLVELYDPELWAEAAVRQARIEQLEVQLATEMFDDRLQAELTRQKLDTEAAMQARIEQRLDEMVAYAQRDGRWIVPNAGDLPGRYERQGALIGYVLSGALRTVRVVVTQDDVDRVRQHTESVRVILADRPWETLRARTVREVPGGSDQLPSTALTLDGGGQHATDPRDASGLKTLARTFQFDIELDTEATDLAFDLRAYVRFEHRPEPLASQVYRRIRQAFLTHLNV